MDKIYDFAVIGGGPGGYVAAIQAAKLGLSAVVIEKDNLGGVCLNWGCIPTKSLLKISKNYNFVKNKAHDFGIEVENVNFNIEKAVAFSRSAVEKLVSGVGFLMKKNNVSVIKGVAKISENKTIIVNEKIIKAKNIVIATGAKFRELKGLEVDGENILNAKHAMVPKSIPKSVLIIGSGAIGMEFASFYSAIGSNVTVVEIMERIMPAVDEEVSNLAKKSFENSGITMYTGSKIISVKKEKGKTFVKISNNKNSDISIEVEKIIVALGVVGNTENIGLENFKSINVENSWIKVDENFQTGESGIYAIGDVIGTPCLAHKASHEGVLVANYVSGKNIYRTQNIPLCIYSNPQIASIGMTEKQATEMGYQVKIGRSYAQSNGKSIATGEMESFVKVIFDKKTGELLGAHMLGNEVTEMIQGIVISKEMEATDEWLKRVIFPHPTVSEMLYESFFDADGNAIHS